MDSEKIKAKYLKVGDFILGFQRIGKVVEVNKTTPDGLFLEHVIVEFEHHAGAIFKHRYLFDQEVVRFISPSIDPGVL